MKHIIENKVFEEVPITKEMEEAGTQCAHCAGCFDDSLCGKLPSCHKNVYKEVGPEIG